MLEKFLAKSMDEQLCESLEIWKFFLEIGYMNNA